MGCGNSKDEKDKHHLTYLKGNETEKNNNHSKKRDSKNKLFHVQNTEEMEKIQKQVEMSAESKNFKKLQENAKSLEIIEWKDLILDEASYYDLVNALNSNNSITSFSMINVDISGNSDKLIHLAKSLMTKEKIINLKFQKLCNLGNKKAKSIAKIMEGCKNVERLVLNDIEFNEKDAQFIGMILKNLSEHLTYFEVSLLFFNDKIQEFLDGLHTNNVIRELVLNKINLDEDSFTYLIEAVSKNICLKKLDVSNNPVKNGVAVFEKYKLKNLEILQMNNCGIDDECFGTLLENIKSSNIIKTIELNHNDITEASIQAVVDYFAINTELEQMYILNNALCKRDLTYKLENKDLIKLVSEI
jgi:hypothetical protein